MEALVILFISTATMTAILEVHGKRLKELWRLRKNK